MDAADVEGQHAVAPQGDDGPSWCEKLNLAILIIAFLLLCMFLMWPDPHYYVGIRSVSGVPAAEAVVNPAFDLTLGLASRNYLGGWCIDGNISVEVAYRGVLLADDARTSRLCVGARKVAELPVVARRAGVCVPPAVMEALHAETTLGEQVFDVTLHLPSTFAGHELYTCRVGVGPSAAAWCT